MEEADCMLGLVANQDRIRARRILDQSAAIGVAMSDKTPVALMEIAGESQSAIAGAEWDAFKAKHRADAKAMMRG